MKDKHRIKKNIITEQQYVILIDPSYITYYFIYSQCLIELKKAVNLL